MLFLVCFTLSILKYDRNATIRSSHECLCDPAGQSGSGCVTVVSTLFFLLIEFPIRCQVEFFTTSSPPACPQCVAVHSVPYSLPALSDSDMTGALGSDWQLDCLLNSSQIPSKARQAVVLIHFSLCGQTVGSLSVSVLCNSLWQSVSSVRYRTKLTA